MSPAGFEPTAPGLGILCSIRLSYGDFIAKQPVRMILTFAFRTKHFRRYPKKAEHLSNLSYSPLGIVKLIERSASRPRADRSKAGGLEATDDLFSPPCMAVSGFDPVVQPLVGTMTGTAAIPAERDAVAPELRTLRAIVNAG